MSNLTQQLQEAVNKLKRADKETKEARILVATLLQKAMKTGRPVTELSEATGINRTTIYWLVNTWSNNSEDTNRRH